MGAIQIINRAAEDCKLIENKQIRQEKVVLLKSAMDKVNHINFGGIKGKSMGAKGAASERLEKSLKSARKAVKRKRAGEDLDNSDDEYERRLLQKHKYQVSLFGSAPKKFLL